MSDLDDTHGESWLTAVGFMFALAIFAIVAAPIMWISSLLGFED